MKGSDKWGEGSGPRVELVVAALLILSLAGVVFYYFETNQLSSGSQVGGITMVSTTGIKCDDGSMPQSAQTVEQDPIFTNLSDGLCYNYLGESPSTMTFAYYNGTITYPCGDAPLETPQSEIQANITAAQTIVSARLVSPPQVGLAESCNPSIAVAVFSVTDVESTIPAVPQLDVTLAVPQGGAPVASLKAVLTLDGGSQTFQFGSVTPNNPLTSGSISSTEIVSSKLLFYGDEVYPMSISGTFADGRAFSYVVHVQITQIP